MAAPTGTAQIPLDTSTLLGSFSSTTAATSYSSTQSRRMGKMTSSHTYVGATSALSIITMVVGKTGGAPQINLLQDQPRGLRPPTLPQRCVGGREQAASAAAPATERAMRLPGLQRHPTSSSATLGTRAKPGQGDAQQICHSHQPNRGVRRFGGSRC